MVGIRTYLLVVVGTLSVLPTLVLGTIETSRASASERSRSDREGTAHATAVATELDSFISTETTAIELLAADIEAAHEIDDRLVPALLARQRDHAPELAMVYVADRDGTSRYVDPPRDADGVPNAGTNYGERDYYRELIASGTTTTSGVELGKRSKLPNVHVAAPIHAHGELSGLVVASINLDRISQVAAHASSGDNGRVIVLDANQHVLADSAENLAVLTDVSALPMLAGSGAAIATTVDELDSRVHVVRVPATRSGWSVFVIRDQASLDALSDSARRDALLIMIVTMLVALVVVAMGVQWLSTPIRALAATTKAIGGGDFSAPMPDRRKFEIQEIGELLGSVRDMARDVQHHRDEQRRAEEVARMNDRLAAIGTLASGVAHEINNPLTYVVGNLWLLRETIDSVRVSLPDAVYEEAVQSLDETLLGVERVTQIVKDMKRLSRPDKSAHAAVDVNALLDSCVRMAAIEVRNRATVTCSYGELPRIQNNEARLSQVFLNLLINAAQACDAADPGANAIRVTTSVTADGVVIEIADTGKGIEPAILSRIFDPFFTTKQPGVGTGLGLSVCMNIVKQSGGTVTVDSALGRGSMFRVTLPIGIADPVRPPRAAAPPAPRTRILVVDDEPAIRTMIARLLVHHDVTIATSPGEAFARAAAEPFDVLITDISMPDEDGLSLHRRLGEAQLGLARSTVFMTGGAIDPADAARLEELGLPCVNKPFTLADLDAAITRVRQPHDVRPRAEAA
jgi:signal transduction histidine kinase/CheY-like chemotaxis protein